MVAIGYAQVHSIKHRCFCERFATQCGNNRAQLVDDPEGKLASRIHMFCEKLSATKMRMGLGRRGQCVSLLIRGLFLTSSFIPFISHVSIVRNTSWLSYARPCSRYSYGSMNGCSPLLENHSMIGISKWPDVRNESWNIVHYRVHERTCSRQKRLPDSHTRVCSSCRINEYCRLLFSSPVAA